MPIGVKICMMVHIGPRQVFCPFGAVPSGIPKKSKVLALKKANILKTASRSVICHLEHNISSTRAF